MLTYLHLFVEMIKKEHDENNNRFLFNIDSDINHHQKKMFLLIMIIGMNLQTSGIDNCTSICF